MSEELKDKINSLRKKKLLNSKDKIKTVKEVQEEKNDIPTRLQKKETTIDKVKMSKGGRIGLKDGSKGCGKATAGRGRAYGKNS